MSEHKCPLGQRSCEFNHMNLCSADKGPIIVDERGKKVCKAYRIKT